MRAILIAPIVHRRAAIVAFAFACAPTCADSGASVAEAETKAPALAPALAGLRFLVGRWDSGAGTVADTGETSRGTSSIEPEVNGSVLLRRDHVELFAADGKATGTFDIIMTIYAEGGTIRADYDDGTHVIHYVSANVVAGSTVAFTSASVPTAPIYRLTYASGDAKTLAVRFEVEPPGASAFATIASGTLHRAAS